MSEVLLPTGSAGWIVKPRLARWTLIRLLVAPVIFLAGPLLLARGHVYGPILFEAPFVLLGAVTIGLYLHNERFMADRSSVSRVNAWGRLRSWPISSIDHVDRFIMRSRYSNFPYMVFLGHDGKPLLTLTGQYWDSGAVEETCNRLGIRLSGSFGESVNVFEASKRLGRGGQRRLLIVAVFIVLGAAAASLLLVVNTNGH